MVLLFQRCPGCGQDVPVDTERKRCYCIYCGYLMGVNLDGSGAERINTGDDGKVSVTISCFDTQMDVKVFVNGAEVASTHGGDTTVRVEPGDCTVTIRAGIYNGSAKGRLNEGSRIVIRNSFAGLKVSVK